MKHWLLKSDVDDYTIDHLKSDKKALWVGVRNYQARNFMTEMKPGDLCLYYHSNAAPSGVAGIAIVSKESAPDPTQFDKKSNYFDDKSSSDKPRWFCPEVKFHEKFTHFVSIDQLREIPALKALLILQRGSRLSVTPVTKAEFDAIVKLGNAK